MTMTGHDWTEDYSQREHIYRNVFEIPLIAQWKFGQSLTQREIHCLELEAKILIATEGPFYSSKQTMLS